jgi:DNA polymerase III delta subunit
MNILYSTEQNLTFLTKNKYKKQPEKYEIVDGSNMDMDTIISLTKQQNIFDDNKIKVFTDINLKNNEKMLVNELKDIEVVFIVLLKPREKISPLLSEYAKELSETTKSDKLKMVEEIIAKNHSSFENEATKDYFYKTIGNDSFALINEAMKLSNYTNTISTKDVDLLVKSFEEQKLFDLVEFIITNNNTKAIKLVDSLIQEKYSVIDIVNIIAYQLFVLKLVANAKGNAFSISKELDVPS